MIGVLSCLSGAGGFMTKIRAGNRCQKIDTQTFILIDSKIRAGNRCQKIDTQTFILIDSKGEAACAGQVPMVVRLRIKKRGMINQQRSRSTAVEAHSTPFAY